MIGSAMCKNSAQLGSATEITARGVFMASSRDRRLNGLAPRNFRFRATRSHLIAAGFAETMRIPVLGVEMRQFHLWPQAGLSYRQRQRPSVSADKDRLRS
jgi:hypothetical protein